MARNFTADKLHTISYPAHVHTFICTEPLDLVAQRSHGALEPRLPRAAQTLSGLVCRPIRARPSLNGAEISQTATVRLRQEQHQFKPARS